MKEFDLIVRPSENFLYNLHIGDRIANKEIREDYINDFSAHYSYIYDCYNLDYIDDEVDEIVVIKAVSSAAVSYFNECMTEEEKEKYYNMVNKEI